MTPSLLLLLALVLVLCASSFLLMRLIHMDEPNTCAHLTQSAAIAASILWVILVLLCHQKGDSQRCSCTGARLRLGGLGGEAQAQSKID